MEERDGAAQEKPRGIAAMCMQIKGNEDELAGAAPGKSKWRPINAQVGVESRRLPAAAAPFQLHIYEFDSEIRRVRRTARDIGGLFFRAKKWKKERGGQAGKTGAHVWVTQ